jgi:threonine synthase
VARYDLACKPGTEILDKGEQSMWRYKYVLPVENNENRITLGEGLTPIISLEKVNDELGLKALSIKDEGQNPTGSFKARGLAMAVSKAIENGVESFCIPTAGNAGSALSAYAAKCNKEVNIFMPIKTPKVFQFDCEITGAKVNKVDGDISAAAAEMRRQNHEGKWFDVTTLKEPFRLEGKKTMGYEIAEQYHFQLPDVIIYPTGGGTGLIGIWKAFKEMKEMGWIENINTRMVAVQLSNCDPIVKAFNEGKDVSEKYENPGTTIANGLRVPKAFGDKLIMRTLYESNGTAISVSDEEILESLGFLSEREGMFLSPEGAATFVACKKLIDIHWIARGDSVLLLNTGSAYKYIENLY